MATQRPSGVSMAARCTACSTVFRVVPDQLRVSEGWVRCGRCAEVFNAAENLIDLDTGAPLRMGAGQPEPPPAAPVRTAAPAPPALPVRPSARPASNAPAGVPAASSAWMPLPVPLPGPDPHPQPSSGLPPQRRPDVAPDFDAEASPPIAPYEATTPLPRDVDRGVDRTDRIEPPWNAAAPEHADTEPLLDEAATADRHDAADAALDGPSPPLAPAAEADLTRSAAATEGTGRALAVIPEGGGRLDATPAAAPAAPLPSFIRSADRAARWRQPRVRAALTAAAVAGALALPLQVAFEYRDLIAARWPVARSALVAACSALGCTVGAARAIESLAVESSGLVRVEKSNVYRLSVSLRNRAGIELALPALDLTLTDAQGQLISRRVLRTSELGAAQATLGPGRELALQATLQSAAQSTAAGVAPAGPVVVAGYTIELFYP
jgi:predicted Zn finger-like uncharacterized protein